MTSLRVTVAVHEDDLADARSLAAYLDDEQNSLMTFVPSGQDADGEQYYAASAPKSKAWRDKAKAPLGDRPAWDTGQDINMTGAERALDALQIWTPEIGGPVPQAAPGVIVAVVHDNGPEALHWMGLDRVEDDGTG